MAQDAERRARSKCLVCGFDAPAGGDEWDAVESPPLGTLTRCPGCGSTNVTTGR